MAGTARTQHPFPPAQTSHTLPLAETKTDPSSYTPLNISRSRTRTVVDTGPAVVQVCHSRNRTISDDTTHIANGLCWKILTQVTNDQRHLL